jgi:hypothetical protein
MGKDGIIPGFSKAFLYQGSQELLFFNNRLLLYQLKKLIVGYRDIYLSIHVFVIKKPCL